MTDDLDARVRDRLRRQDLPPAPERLRTRVKSVAANPPDDTAAQRDVARNGRLLLPLAAVLLIGAVAISTGGGGPRPGDTSGPGATQAGPVHAELIVNARELEWPCSPGGCEVHVTLELPSGPWTGKLTYADLGALRRIEPPLPPLLADGAYRLRADIHVIGDVIEPGQNAPPDYGVAGSCSTEFTIEPDTTVAEVTLDLRGTTCTAGTVMATDPAILPSLEVFPQFDEDCGADVGGCDYSVTLTGATGTWYALMKTVRPPSQRLINELVSMLAPGPYRLEAESHRMGLEREFGVGFQEDLEAVATCARDFVIPADASAVTATVAFQGATCNIDTNVTGRLPTGPPPSAVWPIATPGASFTPNPRPTLPTPAPPAGICITQIPAGLTCEAATEAISLALGSGHPEIMEIGFTSICLAPREPVCTLTSIAQVQLEGASESERFLLNPGPEGWTARRLGDDVAS